MIDDKGTDKRYYISEKKVETLNTDVEVLKLGRLSLHKNKYYLKK